FIFSQQWTHGFETYRSFIHSDSMHLCDRIDQVCGGHAPRGAQLVSARLEQIVKAKPQDMIGRNEPAITVYNAETVGITVGCQSCKSAFLSHGALQWRQIFFGRVGTGPVKEHVAVRANGSDGQTIFNKDPIEPASAASVNGVTDKIAFRFFQNVKTNHAAKLFEVRLARINTLKSIFDFVILARVVLQLSRPLFKVLGDFRESWSPVGPGKFQAIVLRGIMTRGDVYEIG